jgi:aspartyl-tRNA(Asn)/glutamyl-tRNA(Gln) amidotransferase subunit C
MAVDKATVKHVARLARIGVDDAELDTLAAELNAILTFVEELNTLDTESVVPMTSVVEASLKRRSDTVTDGGYAEDVVRNAPEKIDSFFAVPKVVE